MTIGRIPGATGIQPTIVDAKGDIIAATAADSVTRLAVGTNNTVLMADSAEATGLKWGASAQSVMTTKGDLLTENASSVLTRLAVGANDTVLTADSSTATGLKWAAPTSGGMTLLSTTSLSGTSTVVSGISQSYQNLRIIINNAFLTSGTPFFDIKPNSTSSTKGRSTNSGTTAWVAIADIGDQMAMVNSGSAANNTTFLEIQDYANTTYAKPFISWGNNASYLSFGFDVGLFTSATAISSIQFTTSNGTSTFAGGEVRIYGVK